MFEDQSSFNKKYVNNEFDMGAEYAYTIKTVIFTAFFMPIQPIVCLFAPIALALIYFCNKYRLFYRFDRPRFYGFQVNDTLDYILGLAPVVFCLGEIYAVIWVGADVEIGVYVVIWVGLGVAVLFYVFPARIFYYFTEKPERPDSNFEEKRFVIPSDYDRLNPFTREKAIS